MTRITFGMRERLLDKRRVFDPLGEATCEQIAIAAQALIAAFWLSAATWAS